MGSNPCPGEVCLQCSRASVLNGDQIAVISPTITICFHERLVCFQFIHRVCIQQADPGQYIRQSIDGHKSLYDVGTVKTVHAIGAKNSFLLRVTKYKLSKKGPFLVSKYLFR